MRDIVCKILQMCEKSSLLLHTFPEGIPPFSRTHEELNLLVEWSRTPSAGCAPFELYVKAIAPVIQWESHCFVYWLPNIFLSLGDT